MTNSTTRFTNRVDDYVKYRPHYPAAIVDALESAAGISSSTPVVDIGSGTGISSELFLKRGYKVIGVEPNEAMRRAAEQLLADQPGFHSVDGTAEATTLPNASAGLIVAGQAFHWFDQQAAREEFRRILLPEAIVALIWNERQTDTTPFLREYETLLQTYGTDYEAVRHTSIDPAEITGFFAPGKVALAVFENAQHFDFEGLRGRLMSSSYAPASGHPQHEPTLAALRELFEQYHHNGVVDFLYQTRVWYGGLPPR